MHAVQSADDMLDSLLLFVFTNQHDAMIKKEDFKITGILVIFNNLLQSLFDSQIKTLGITFAGIFLLLLILFKSFWWSVVAAIPNFTAALFILGSLGLFNIPLDMMTITIASITVGIAIDNSIHYIYRFREEFKINKNYNILQKYYNFYFLSSQNTSLSTTTSPLRVETVTDTISSAK